MQNTVGVEEAVRARYEQAAREREEDLCCPVEYEARYLEVIPREILDRDYGCGDPSRYARPGETVLDLGSGSGKICYILAQRVGPEGRVIGIDFNDEMLQLARRHQGEVARRLGYSNVEFRKGRIQDLRLDYELLDLHLKKHPVADSSGMLALEAHADTLRRAAPLLSDQSIDLVVSNCVLNLVRDDDKRRLVSEIFRVLRVGGRIAVSDIVCDEDLPEDLKKDPELWSGCISGAFREEGFLEVLESAGFYGISIDRWESRPFRTIEGIEFRAVTVIAYKGKEGPCLERNQAVIYRGPWKKVCDDDGHVLERGKRMAVCDKTFRIYSKAPYRDDFVFVEPYIEIPLEEAGAFDCRGRAFRHPRETKGMDYHVTETSGESCCGPDGCC
ncbi:MAG: methyltransferase domain-containing protein [Acidobacteria bacterium]|nr:methyltransferase domain-containing protein [Acidobacteriota bacterium]